MQHILKMQIQGLEFFLLIQGKQTQMHSIFEQIL